jgi:hypothetical protein
VWQGEHHWRAATKDSRPHKQTHPLLGMPVSLWGGSFGLHVLNLFAWLHAFSVGGGQGGWLHPAMLGTSVVHVQPLTIAKSKIPILAPSHREYEVKDSPSQRIWFQS